VVPASNGSATTAMVLSLVGLIVGLFTWVGFLLGIGGILVGRRARREIAASGGTQGGSGSATVGVVLGWIDLGLFVLGILVLILFVGMIATFLSQAGNASQ
jgi:hypothetical protein